MNKYLLLIIISIISFRCAESDTKISLKTIALEKALDSPGCITASQIGKSIRYIPLETRDSITLIGSRPNVKVVDDKIIVASNGANIKVFDLVTGKYLYDIGEKSRSPRGSFNLSSYIFNPFKKELLIHAYENYRYRVWDINGNFLRTSQFPNTMYEHATIFSTEVCHDFVSSERSLFFTGASFMFFGENDTTFKSVQLGIVSDDVLMSNVKNLISYPNASGATGTLMHRYIWIMKTHEGKEITAFRAERPFYYYDNKLYFKNIHNDTAYLITNDTIIPAWHFDVGKYTLTKEEMSTGKYGSDRAKIGQVLENDNFILFECIFSDGLFGFYNKHTKEVKTGLCIDKIKDDFNDFIPFEISSTSSNGSFVAIVEPFQIIDWVTQNPEKKNLLPQVKENDNIVVAIIE